MRIIPTENGFRRLVSLLIYIVAVLLVFLIIRPGKSESVPLIAWIKQSQNPNIGIASLSLLIASLAILILTKGLFPEFTIFGITINTGKQWSEKLSHIFYISPFFLAITIISALIYLLFLPPSCSPPNIKFVVNMGDSTHVYTPESEVDIGKLNSVIISIEEDSSRTDLYCSFEATGDNLERFNKSRNSCSTTIFVNDKPGIIVLSVETRHKYCDNSSFNSLSIRRR